MSDVCKVFERSFHSKALRYSSGRFVFSLFRYFISLNSAAGAAQMKIGCDLPSEFLLFRLLPASSLYSKKAGSSERIEMHTPFPASVVRIKV